METHKYPIGSQSNSFQPPYPAYPGQMYSGYCDPNGPNVGKPINPYEVSYGQSRIIHVVDAPNYFMGPHA